MPSKKAFTLTEIVVVLAIVATLALMLFAAIGRQRQNAYQTTCQSNLGQLYKAFQMYVQDHDSRFPNGHLWDRDVRPYLKNSQALACPTTINRAINETSYRFHTRLLNAKLPGAPSDLFAFGINESALPSNFNIFVLTDGVGFDNRPFGTSLVVPYPRSCSTSYGAYYATYHNGGANYLFVDGHVKWFLPQSIVDFECATGN